MLSAVLQPEIDTLQSQIAQFQSQIAQAEQRITHLTEVESIASGAIESLQSALKEVSALAPNALVNLKSAVLALFTGDSREAEKQTVSTTDTFVDHQNPIDLHTGFSDPLNEVLEVEQPFVKLVQVSKALAYQIKQDGEIICTYAGFNNKNTAKRWGEWLAISHSVASAFEIRESKRLTDYKYELKLWSMSIKQIDKLANCDTSLDPRSCYPDAPKRQPSGAPPIARLVTAKDVTVGNVVRSRTVKHWEYTVIAIKEDGLLDCERIGVTPLIRVAMHPSSIEIISKAENILEAANASIQPPLEHQFTYSLLDATNLDQKWSVSRATPEGKQQFLGSVSCGTDTQRWTHSRQPKYGDIKSFPSKETAAAYLASSYDRDTMPRAGIEPDF